MRTFRLRILTVLVASLALSCAFAGQTVRYWYHVDNPDKNIMPELVAEFEKQNPGISVKAELIPWNSYYDNLFTSIIGGNAPDAAQLKLATMVQLMEMDAIEPLDDYIAKWPGREDVLDALWDKMKAPDGKIYLLPMHYNVSYLYIRKDLFDEHKVKIPTNKEEFLAAAKALTLDTNGDGRVDIYGFGFRGSKGGQEHWGVFALPNAREMSSAQLTDPYVVESNQFLIDMFRVHEVMPRSAPNDGFNEITTAFRTGLTAMTIHHIGSSDRMVEALGDKVTAVPLPRCGKNGEGWAAFNDEEHGVLSASKNKDAAFKWIAFLAEAENNNKLATMTGQLPVTKSGSAKWDLHEKRFLDATMESLPFSYILPLNPATQEFINSTWPSEMQRALLGEITSKQMLDIFDKQFNQ